MVAFMKSRGGVSVSRRPEFNLRGKVWWLEQLVNPVPQREKQDDPWILLVNPAYLAYLASSRSLDNLKIIRAMT